MSEYIPSCESTDDNIYISYYNPNDVFYIRYTDENIVDSEAHSALCFLNLNAKKEAVGFQILNAMKQINSESVIDPALHRVVDCDSVMKTAKAQILFRRAIIGMVRLAKYHGKLV